MRSHIKYELQIKHCVKYDIKLNTHVGRGNCFPIPLFIPNCFPPPRGCTISSSELSLLSSSSCCCGEGARNCLPRPVGRFNCLPRDGEGGKLDDGSSSSEDELSSELSPSAGSGLCILYMEIKNL